jgi:hypothetical protein
MHLRQRDATARIATTTERACVPLPEICCRTLIAGAALAVAPAAAKAKYCPAAWINLRIYVHTIRATSCPLAVNGASVLLYALETGSAAGAGDPRALPAPAARQRAADVVP